MQSRMDKYNTSEEQVSSRTARNQELYDEVRNSELTEFDINSNISVIDDNAERINVDKVRKMLDQRYSDAAPKRRSIEIPKDDEPIVEEPIADTKEYDINVILAKAKKGKNVDYTKERLKKVREAQYEILNNLDLEVKKVDELRATQNKEAEDNLMNLINTITELEIKNKTNSYSKETSEALDLLSDLKEEETELETELATEEELDEDEDSNIEEDEDEKENEDIHKKSNRDSHVEETLSKLNIDISSYDDFSDISKRDNSLLFIKIIIFLIVIALVIGAIYILNNVLGLGLF